VNDLVPRTSRDHPPAHSRRRFQILPFEVPGGQFIPVFRGYPIGLSGPGLGKESATAYSQTCESSCLFGRRLKIRILAKISPYILGLTFFCVILTFF
jgi:hypothetical protein